ncbi:exonuclease domain-containing protein [Poritiphilus flavus]|uniref:Excinuclease cho n=1 Tax=Poritiphilus flavus TaxID=2697053 RepID=A0A6L9EI12_9FLAO|nr:exonuclease domain-containing protein [Poritiphilus flavus]NAS14286.1 GIY-YIG nuclease family protein [Poritiphilus flavus]
MYTIVDIETTGTGIQGNRITEIAIFKFDGKQVVEEFTSLVNPECEIPYFITGLTGIDNHMVRNAPLLGEIANEIEEITRDCVFVAHSVNFDYNVIKNELRGIGIDFVRKKLCTVRLSRQLLPGFHSYSLGKLCSSLDIPITDRHRARGDAYATTLLFKKLIDMEGAETVFRTFLNARSQEATLPPGLSRAVFNKLPSRPGVYYFKNKKGEIIYVGKAVNIKKRVLGHFYDKASREMELCRETSDIAFELSGSELLALLMESGEIKRHYPKFNRAQKRPVQQYGLFSYVDRKGIRHLAFNKLRHVPQALFICYNTTDARLFMEQLCEAYKLCPKYCHLQEQVKHCSHFRLTNCEGICRETEAISAYNEKVEMAIRHLSSTKEDFLIREKGRNPDEDAVILVQEGNYRGYGFISKELEIRSLEDILAHIKIEKNTPETTRLVESYRIKHPENVFSLSLKEVG